MRTRRWWIAGIGLGIVLLCLPGGPGQRLAIAAYQHVKGRATVAERVAQYGPAARARLKPAFAAAGVAYPPAQITLIGCKAESTLELWAAGPDGAWRQVKTYRILGQSGGPGPKLREGDRQVPEGVYRIESLNPNSLYHLSLRLDYPNAFDREQGRTEGRTRLGGDIMIHGKSVSIGCLAMGDPAAEELFVLAAETGLDKLAVLLTPVDFRRRELPPELPPLPAWTAELYDLLRVRLKAFPHPVTP